MHETDLLFFKLLKTHLIFQNNCYIMPDRRSKYLKLWAWRYFIVNYLRISGRELNFIMVVWHTSHLVLHFNLILVATVGTFWLGVRGVSNDIYKWQGSSKKNQGKGASPILPVSFPWRLQILSVPSSDARELSLSKR